MLRKVGQLPRLRRQFIHSSMACLAMYAAKTDEARNFLFYTAATVMGSIASPGKC